MFSDKNVSKDLLSNFLLLMFHNNNAFRIIKKKMLFTISSIKWFVIKISFWVEGKLRGEGQKTGMSTKQTHA